MFKCKLSENSEKNLKELDYKKFLKNSTVPYFDCDC